MPCCRSIPRLLRVALLLVVLAGQAHSSAHAIEHWAEDDCGDCVVCVAKQPLDSAIATLATLPAVIAPAHAAFPVPTLAANHHAFVAYQGRAPPCLLLP